MGIIETVYGAGDDALAHEFQVLFGPLPYFPDIPFLENQGARVVSFEVPSQSIGEYSYKFRGETISKPNGEITTPKEFSIELRMDKYYVLYKAIRTWMSVIVNPDTGLPALDVVNKLGLNFHRIPITVSTGYHTDRIFGIDTSFEAFGERVNLLDYMPTLQAWFFTGCWPKSISEVSLDNQSGEPLVSRITFGYLKLL
jgi:hypothetical protein